MRINARLDEDHIQKLEALKLNKHMNTTEVVKQAIDLLFEQNQLHPKGSIHSLLESDFIGCFEGPEDLSENYKKAIGDYLDEKYPDR